MNLACVLEILLTQILSVEIERKYINANYLIQNLQNLHWWRACYTWWSAFWTRSCCPHYWS